MFSKLIVLALSIMTKFEMYDDGIISEDAYICRKVIIYIGLFLKHWNTIWSYEEYSALINFSMHGVWGQHG